ncbi:hypothetical protein DO021_08955 [Desulfobacter hydrogenophilus]|uniref:Uncharacterized protein n=1 Tax=Desulfobacter hydrogenophilus TaxID=2291 RepID=A0A328FH40_9BACT|nr:hypothetical protein DO021_08955 [Desulfobacter hydrogenophilus]
MYIFLGYCFVAVDTIYGADSRFFKKICLKKILLKKSSKIFMAGKRTFFRIQPGHLLNCDCVPLFFSYILYVCQAYCDDILNLDLLCCLYQYVLFEMRNLKVLILKGAGGISDPCMVDADAF